MEEPLGDVATEESTADAATEEPLAGVATEEPTAGAATEEPLESFASDEPSACAAMDEPTAGAATEESSDKKLLVLDVNGLLIATYHKHQKMPAEKHYTKLGNFFVYERPGCAEFLDFCFKHFVVGVWSSAREHNVNSLVNHIFKDLKHGLSFSWHQRHCTTTAVMHPDNNKKPIFLKELSKLWAEVEPGRFDQSNTLLIDDSPYKALKNPPHTGIFPQCYNGDEVDDNFLTVLRTYLEGLYDARDVQEYVRTNPIGEPCISSEHPLWGYFSSILNEGAQELDLTATNAMVNGVTSASSFSQQVQKFANQINPEEIELEDMDQPPKRRDPSPAGVAAHSGWDKVQASQQMVREPEDGTTEEMQWRRNAGNGHELENGRTQSRRNYERSMERSRERSRERSPRMRMNHTEDRRRSATNHGRDTPDFAHQPRSYHGEYNTGRDRDLKSRGSWHNQSGVHDTLSRESYGRRSSEYDIGRSLPSPGGRQFMTSGINIRDLPPPPVFSAQDSGRGLLPPPVLHLPSRSWDYAERPTPYYDNFGGRRNVNLNGPIELDRSWEKPAIPGRGREYDRRWEEPVSSSQERGYDRGWVRPVSSGRGSEYDRRWEEPVISRPGSQYDRRWEEPMSSARGSEYDRRWKEPASAGRDRGYDTGWDRQASSCHGKEYGARWRDPAPSVDVGRGREFSTRWDEPAQSNYRKDCERQWEQPVSSGNTRDYDPKWSRSASHHSQYAPPPPPPRVGYSSQRYRNPSVDYKDKYPPERNIAVDPRDDHRPHHWGVSNYRR